MMMMNKRGRAFDCERQNNKTLMQSFVDILYVFPTEFICSQINNFPFSGRRITSLFRNMPAGMKYDPVRGDSDSVVTVVHSKEHTRTHG